MAASTLDDIESDKESTLDEHGSAVVRSASKEQVRFQYSFFSFLNLL